MVLTVTLNPCVDKTLLIRRTRPGEVIPVAEMRAIAGGKGINVSRVLNGLGVENLALSLSGGETGLHFQRLAGLDHIDLCNVGIQGHTRTVTTVRESETRVSTAYAEPGPSVSREEERALICRYEELLGRASLVILSGSVPCDSLNGIYRVLIERARGQGVPCFLDSRGEALGAGVQARPDILKPNLKELESLVGERLNTTESRVRAVRGIAERGVGIVVLTMGEEGALLLSDERFLTASPPRVESVNPVGSGDAFVAGFSSSFVRGEPLEKCLQRGVAAGAANARMWDAASCTGEEIEELFPLVSVEERVGGAPEQTDRERGGSVAR